MNLKKNNLRANQLRLEGNDHYKACRFYEALTFYNKSLCHAIPGSKELSMSFANRSAVYLEIKEFELCLENIKLAFDCGYPAEKIGVLIKRREKCLDLIELHEDEPIDDPWLFFKLSYAANPKLPFIVNCIEMRHSKNFGRHLVTTKSLKAGDIICIEEPFNKFVMNRARFSNCANCLKSENLNLFPCCECNYSE
jgi:hypothetical protein